MWLILHINKHSRGPQTKAFSAWFTSRDKGRKWIETVTQNSSILKKRQQSAVIQLSVNYKVRKYTVRSPKAAWIADICHFCWGANIVGFIFPGRQTNWSITKKERLFFPYWCLSDNVSSCHSVQVIKAVWGNRQVEAGLGDLESLLLPINSLSRLCFHGITKQLLTLKENKYWIVISCKKQFICTANQRPVLYSE